MRRHKYEPLTRARADAVAELNYARAFNFGLEAAERVAVKSPTIVMAIEALKLPFRRKEVEAIFDRRDELSSKKRSAAEETEWRELRLEIANLPTGHSPEDQMAMDLIHEAAQLLGSKDIKNEKEKP